MFLGQYLTRKKIFYLHKNYHFRTIGQIVKKSIIKAFSMPYSSHSPINPDHRDYRHIEPYFVRFPAERLPDIKFMNNKRHSQFYHF